jgi:hypothetical protein
VKRTERGGPLVEKPDYSPLLRAIMYLDEALKRGVVVGVYENSMEVSDHDIEKALKNVRHQMDLTIETMERTARAVSRVTALPGSALLQ